MLYIFYAVPSGAPTINQAMVISPTEVEVSWFEVDPIHQNGIITVYEVDYQPLTDFGSEDVTRVNTTCLLYTSPSPRDATLSRMPSSA